MTRRILKNTFLLGLTVLGACIVIFFVSQYRQTLDETYAALKSEAVYAANGLEIGGIEYLKNLANTNRVTWIDTDGKVLYDSEYPDLSDNQRTCPEVVSALKDGEGHGIRKSQSGGMDTMYYAFRCRDGTILRLSRPLSVVRYALLSVSPVLWAFVLVLLISGIVAFNMARQILKPVYEINLDHPETSESYPELEPLVTKLQEQKEMIREQIEDKERMRREFSANVSHELKTPLTSISGFAELMTEGFCTEDKMREFSRDIYKESQRLITLVDDIIKLSKLDEEEVPLEFEAVDLYGVGENVIDVLKPQAEEKDIDMTLTGEHTMIRGVWQLIYEMVFNLCDNAIKYNWEGGYVHVVISEQDGYSKIRIEDNGIGIPEEEQERVFERFYRVDKSHSKSIGGTGLGLSIVKHGAQLHDAKIHLQSELGKGTTIEICFAEKKE